MLKTGSITVTVNEGADTHVHSHSLLDHFLFFECHTEKLASSAQPIIITPHVHMYVVPCSGRQQPLRNPTYLVEKPQARTGGKRHPSPSQPYNQSVKKKKTRYFRKETKVSSDEKRAANSHPPCTRPKRPPGAAWRGPLRRKKVKAHTYVRAPKSGARRPSLARSDQELNGPFITLGRCSFFFFQFSKFRE